MTILQAIAAIPRIADALEGIARMMTLQAASKRR